MQHVPKPKKSRAVRHEKLFSLTEAEITFLTRERALTGLTYESMAREIGHISQATLCGAVTGGKIRETKIIVIREYIRKKNSPPPVVERVLVRP